MSAFEYECAKCGAHLLTVDNVSARTFVSMCDQVDETHICGEPS